MWGEAPNPTVERWLLPALAFVVSVAYWPFWHDGAVSPKWSLMALSALLLFMVRPRLSSAHWIGAAFIAWSAVTLSWAVSPYDGIGWLIKMMILWCVFLIASSGIDLRRTWVALGVGVGVSGVMALIEVVGIGRLAPAAIGPAGLFGNKNYLAEAGVLMLIVAIHYRMWLLTPFIAMAAVLPASRASMLALSIAGAVALYRKSPRIALSLIVAALIFGVLVTWVFGIVGTDSLTQRRNVWGIALSNLSIGGYGFGSFQAAYPLVANYVTVPTARPEHAHNEYINLLFEVGVPGALLAALFVVSFSRGLFDRRNGLERHVVVALMVIAFFSFPLRLPVCGFIAALVAGSLCARGYSLRNVVHACRAALFGSPAHRRRRSRLVEA